MNAINPESIKLHSAQAKYYKYREPYLQDLFVRLSNKLQLNPESRLLDICCGSGELAKGFSDYVGKIYAVDGSAEMLSFAPPLKNTVYSQHDVNLAVFKAPEPVDHFVIGRAIHWIGPDSLVNLIKANLKTGGRIVICSTQWSADWGSIYSSLLREYKDQPVRRYDFTGAETLRGAGFEAVDRFSVRRKGKFDLQYLIDHTLSTSYGDSLKRLSLDIDRFRTALLNNLSPYFKDGKLEADFASWSRIYAKTGDDNTLPD
ncbi:MAG: class I SAM-dependent methyltransferase [Alphaproteobacteria bacterium]|nr:class I SAM-dependent methyltransferase [Alphaproteobacteria bacterium]